MTELVKAKTLRDIISMSRDDDLIGVYCCQDSSAVHILMDRETTAYTQEPGRLGEIRTGPLIPTVIFNIDRNWRAIK